MALSVTLMMKGESPSAAILRTVRNDGSIFRKEKRNRLFLRKKKDATHAAETPCERMSDEELRRERERLIALLDKEENVEEKKEKRKPRSV